MTTRSIPALLYRSCQQQHANLRRLMARCASAVAGRLRHEIRWLEWQRRNWLRDMADSRMQQPRLLRAHVAAQAGRAHLLDVPLELISDDPRMVHELRSFDSPRR
jgi:hypothetical protein